MRSHSRQPRVLLAQPSLQPPGGGNAIATWMLQALKEDYDLTVLTVDPVDATAINRFYGTTLSQSDFAHIPTGRTLRAIAVPAMRLDLVRRCLIMRHCQRLARDYDVVIGAQDVADFGRTGIQYIHYPWPLFQTLPHDERRWYHGRSVAQRAYHAACQRLSRFSFERMRANLTLVNSDWTGRRVRAVHGIDSLTVYPPVPGDFRPVPWENRDDTFVCVGRLIPDKELDKVIDILTAVRARGHAVRLLLVGTVEDSRYLAHIRRRAAATDWIEIGSPGTRAQLAAALGTHRFGIHGKRDEHFGIAVAEMVRAGSIVFVPDDGGQVEIVGEAAPLRYRGVEQAVENICAVLRSPPTQTALRAHLAARAPRFAPSEFVERVRAVVATFLAKGPTQNTATSPNGVSESAIVPTPASSADLPSSPPVPAHAGQSRKS